MKKRKGLGARYSASYESRDNAGNKGKGIMNWKEVEGEIDFFKAEDSRNRFDIIPYKVTTANHPLVSSGDMEVGDIDYVMDVWVHRGIGPQKKDVVCLDRNFGKTCPICKEAFKYREEGDSDAFDDLKAKRKVFYNVRDAKDPKKVKVFEASHFLFEKELIEEARNASDDGEVIDFADPDSGMTVQFHGKEKKFGTNSYLEFKSFRFLDREKPLRDAMIEDAVKFDAIMTILSTSEIEAILFEDEDEEAPRKQTKKPPRDEDEDDDPMVEDQDEDEKPSKKSTDSGCPSGHTFGEDCDDHEECNDCDCWDACYKASK